MISLVDIKDAILNKFVSAEEEEMYHGGNNKSEEEYLNQIRSNKAKCNNGEEGQTINDIIIEKEKQTPNSLQKTIS
ncbi:hypothetical protein FQA39_LY10843 [Lamprigera yunnana]|nr:hypothetical protein FQA39_LY10843 [Lamprigera yunnana]